MQNSRIADPERAVFINRAAAEAFMRAYSFCNSGAQYICTGIMRQRALQGYGVTIVRTGKPSTVVTEELAHRYK